MPELPEVETMRQGILEIVGSRVVDARPTACDKRPILIEPRPQALRRRVIDRTITDVGRVGKRVVIHLDSGDLLVIEPRMTGLVLLATPPTTEHLRLRLTLEGGRADEVLYWDRRGLGIVRLVTPKQFDERYGLDKLGPDALTISVEDLSERLGSSRRAIKVALLDQRAVAGVGNLYASELLHLAGVHPERRCDQLRPAQWRRIHGAMNEVLRMAIRYEGSTLSDGTYRNALNESGGYQNHHRVYDRAGQACPSCTRGEIVRIVQAQRCTFYCRQCQTKRG